MNCGLTLVALRLDIILLRRGSRNRFPSRTAHRARPLPEWVCPIVGGLLTGLADHLIGGLHTYWRATHLIGGPLGGGPLGGGPKKSASEQIVESDARD